MIRRAALILLFTPGVLFGLGSLASASTSLPPDQLVINGSCISVSDLRSLAEQAILAYEDNGPPAGVWVDGVWAPANMLIASAAEYATDGCAWVGSGSSEAGTPSTTLPAVDSLTTVPSTVPSSTTPTTDPPTTVPSTTVPAADPPATVPLTTTPTTVPTTGTPPTTGLPTTTPCHVHDTHWGEGNGHQGNWHGNGGGQSNDNGYGNQGNGYGNQGNGNGYGNQGNGRGNK